MSTIQEKGGGTFQGIKLLLCENPLPPIDEASAAAQAEAPRRCNILIKPLNDRALGPDYMRVTTALPEDNRRFVEQLREVLSRA